MIRMRVTSPKLTYDTRRMVAGDTFLARDHDARALEYIKRAERYEDQTMRISPARDPAGERERLLSLAEALGVTVDRRWGVKRLKDAIDGRKVS